LACLRNEEICEDNSAYGKGTVDETESPAKIDLSMFVIFEIGIRERH
jgi:hypothetical protein